ncbi:fimbrial protein [Enterobacter sp. ENT02]|uniref:fimbrial protein n=1 Tax=Enterobacter sp. ENT02 TaxID=2854767 RepID=UPI001C482D24|nr:fimbrial protein [Enterobacter sp. ENT02]MBV7559735.1 fimbrial protein [Enterobacter sp. ENT02]
MKFFFNFLFSLLLLCVTREVMACKAVEYVSKVAQFSGTINVPIGLSVGGTIASVTIQPTNKKVFSCNWQAGEGLYYAVGIRGFTSQSSIANVYRTNVPGVGIRITNGLANGYLNSPDQSFSVTTSDYAVLDKNPVVVSLIKIGDISSGSLNSLTIGAAYGDRTPQNNNYTVYLSSSANITSVGCTLFTTSTSITIGNISKSVFTTQGINSSTASNRISISCAPATKVYLSTSGSYNIYNRSYYGLNGQGQDGVAQGIGVEVCFDTKCISPNASGILINTPTGTIPIYARYKQLTSSDRVTPGKANASLSVTFTYQ